MNKKNKIILTSIGLTILSGLAATSSTFAWFTTTRTATISYSSATVVSKDGDLEIKLKSVANTDVNANTTGVTQSLVLTGANKVTDISGNGTNFYKPVWSATTNVASEINALSTVEGNWIEFVVTVSRSNTTVTDGTFKVYVGADTKIEAATSASADVNAAKATRLYLSSSDSNSLYYAPDAETEYKYLAAAATGTTAYGVDKFKLDEITPASSVYNSFTKANTIATADSGTLIVDLSAAVTSVDVKVVAWIEGTDQHAINNAINGVFKINLDLYALSA